MGLRTLVSRTQFAGSPQGMELGSGTATAAPPSPRGLEQQAGPLGTPLRVSLTHSLFPS